MRWSRALTALALIILFVAACGSPAVDAENGDGNGSEQTEPAEASQGDGGGDGGDDGGEDGGGDGGGSAGNAEEAFERLTPPNSEEVTKTTASGLIFAAFNSPDSIDSLTSFYEDAFDDLDLQILSTTEAAGGITWFVGTDDSASEFGGVVAVGPATDGGSGSTISIQIGATNQ